MNEEAWTLKDPQVRMAVKDLLRASDHLRAAYADWLHAPAQEAEPRLGRVTQAQRQVDQARKRVHEAELMARAALRGMQEKSWGSH